jgi:hypothetical protein
MNMKWMLIPLCAGVLAGCSPPASPEPAPQKENYQITIVPAADAASSPYTGFSGGSGLKVTDADYTSDDGTYGVKHLSGLNHHSLFLIKVNHSANEVGPLSTGWAESFNMAPGRTARPSGSRPIPAELPAFRFGGRQILKDLPQAMEFNNSPAPVSAAQRLRGMQRLSVYALGDTRDFWVQDAEEAWIEIPATLRAESARAKVWIADTDYSSHLDIPARDIADTFVPVYDYTTGIFGHEPGYPGGPGAGGIDGDEKIHILIYDIGFDQGTGNASIAGFFWAKDLFVQADINNWKTPPPRTNMAEMIYLDAEFAGTWPDFIRSALIHEFQHMIGYHEKQLIRGLPAANNEWYSEMLAMLAEDIIAPRIGVGPGSSGHPSQGRIPEFLINYFSLGVNRWDDSNLLLSYANAYAFGAYLARNFGGAALIREIASNNYMNEASINAALRSSANPVAEINDIQSALGRYGEALVYGNSSYNSGRLSFNRTSETVSGFPFLALNLWSHSYTVANIDNFPGPYRGPLVFNLEYVYGMRGNSLIVQSRPDWQNVSGDLILALYRPTDPDIDLYIMVR